MNTTLSFEAHAVGFLEDAELGLDALVLAEADGGVGRRLEIQRSRDSGDSDLTAGQNTYCLVNENQATVYDAVSVMVLCDEARGRRGVHIWLNPKAATELGTGQYHIRFDASDFPIVKRALETICPEAMWKPKPLRETDDRPAQ